MTLRDLWRRLLRRIPGTELHLAAKKRRLERELQAAGLTATEALYVVSRKYPRRRRTTRLKTR